MPHEVPSTHPDPVILLHSPSYGALSIGVRILVEAFISLFLLTCWALGCFALRMTTSRYGMLPKFLGHDVGI
jgi:hypothetical protein